MSNTITLPQTLLKRLEKISTGSRHTPESIVKQAVKNQLDYEEWKLEQIDAGLAELKAGKGIPHDEFWVKIGTVKNARKKAA
jgi:predicted transcriptional regulator